jgi:hypothetical protein
LHLRQRSSVLANVAALIVPRYQGAMQLEELSIALLLSFALASCSGPAPEKERAPATAAVQKPAAQAEARYEDIEAKCAAHGQLCPPESEAECEICGPTVVSSYASCHSKSYCKTRPMQ